MGSVVGKGKSREDIEMALAKAKEIVSSNPVVVFRFDVIRCSNQESFFSFEFLLMEWIFSGSKTYCSYCQRVKQLFSQLKATFKTVELNQESMWFFSPYFSLNFIVICFESPIRVSVILVWIWKCLCFWRWWGWNSISTERMDRSEHCA